jgi:hypothetical protein
VLLLRPFRLIDALGHAGFSPDVLRALPAHQVGAWSIVTPVSSRSEQLASSKLYRSIAEHVDDDEKRANFAALMNGLFRAAGQENYQEVLRASSITMKVAHEFRFRNKTEKLWELKQGKKDRVYLYPLGIVGSNKERRRAIAVLLAWHKKDQTTPRDVVNYCEGTIKAHVNPQAQLEFC